MHFCIAMIWNHTCTVALAAMVHVFLVLVRCFCGNGKISGGII
jgi:hypothetical protein